MKDYNEQQRVRDIQQLMEFSYFREVLIDYYSIGVALDICSILTVKPKGLYLKSNGKRVSLRRLQRSFMPSHLWPINSGVLTTVIRSSLRDRAIAALCRMTEKHRKDQVEGLTLWSVYSGLKLDESVAIIERLTNNVDNKIHLLEKMINELDENYIRILRNNIRNPLIHMHKEIFAFGSKNVEKLDSDETIDAMDSAIDKVCSIFRFISSEILDVEDKLANLKEYNDGIWRNKPEASLVWCFDFDKYPLVDMSDSLKP